MFAIEHFAGQNALSPICVFVTAPFTSSDLLANLIYNDLVIFQACMFADLASPIWSGRYLIFHGNLVVMFRQMAWIPAHPVKSFIEMINYLGRYVS